MFFFFFLRFNDTELEKERGQETGHLRRKGKSIIVIIIVINEKKIQRVRAYSQRERT